jgi:hypothetical protein
MNVLDNLFGVKEDNQIMRKESDGVDLQFEIGE